MTLSDDRLSALHRFGPVWDTVLDNLDLPSLKTLRLTSKRMAEACIHHRFQGFIEHQTTDLGTKSLKSLAALAAHPLGRGVKHVTVLAAVYDTTSVERILETKKIQQHQSNGIIHSRASRSATEEELSQFRSELEWVQENKRDQEETSEDTIADLLVGILQAFGVLNRVELEATPICGRDDESQSVAHFRDWRAAWEHAARAYRIAMKALVRSKATVEKLTIYRDTLRFGVSPRHIASQVQWLHAQADAGDLKGIKEFALCIGIGSMSADEENQHLAAAAELLKVIPNLETLDLQFYVAKSGSEAQDPRSVIFQNIASATHLLSLKRCRLRGAQTSRESLMQLMTNSPNMTSLDLDDVVLLGGAEWSEVLPALVKGLPSLGQLRLSNLWGPRGFMNVDLVGRSRALVENKTAWVVPCLGGLRVHTILLEGDELKQDIKFRPRPGGRPLGSPQAHNWMLRREMEYAPYWD